MKYLGIYERSNQHNAILQKCKLTTKQTDIMSNYSQQVPSMQMRTKCCCPCTYEAQSRVNHNYSSCPQTETYSVPCKNYCLKCPCTYSTILPLPNQNQLPLRAMQKALVAKWTELEKLGQTAHDYWCQRRALQQQLDCYRIRICRPEEQLRLSQTSNLVQQYNPSMEGTYTGTMRIKDTDNCTCNGQNNTSSYNGVVRLHDRNQPGGSSDCTFQLEKFQADRELSQLSDGLAEAIQREKETQQQLQSVRTELACLQSKIKSFWGDNALDKCTPAKENRAKFF